MLDAVDAAALKFTQNVMERCATPMLQRKFVALGGLDMLLNFIRTSVNDDVVSSAATVLHMLVVTSKGECLCSSHCGPNRYDHKGYTRVDSMAKEMAVASLLVQLRRTRNRRVILAVTSVLNDVVASYLADRGTEATAAPLFPCPDDTASLVVGLLDRKVGCEESLAPRSVHEEQSNQSVGKTSGRISNARKDGRKAPSCHDSGPVVGSDHIYSHKEHYQQMPRTIIENVMEGKGHECTGGACKHDDGKFESLYLARKRERAELDAGCAALIYHMCAECPGESSVSMATVIGKAGGVEALLTICRECHDTDESCLESSVLRWTVNALCALLMSDKNHEAFASSGGPQLFVQLLDISSSICKTPSSAQSAAVARHDISGVQSAGVLHNFIPRDFTLPTLNRHSAPNNVAVHDDELISESTDGHQIDFLPYSRLCMNLDDAIGVQVQRYDCSAQVLEQLARSLSNFMASHRSQTVVAAVGGAEVFVKIIQQHVNLVNNQHRCSNDGFRSYDDVWMTTQQMVRCNPTIQRDIPTSIADISVVEQVCAALCNLTFENDSSRIRVGQVGGCEALVDLLTAYYYRFSRGAAYCKAVVEQCCAAIGNICKKNRTNRTTVGKVGGCEILIAVIVDAPSESCLIQAVRAVGNVATRCAENQLKIAAADGIRILVKHIQSFSLRLGTDYCGSNPDHKSEVDLALGIDVNDPQSDERSGRTPRCLNAISSKTFSASQNCSPMTSAASTPRSTRCNLGHSSAVHRETILQLSLAALVVLTEHECCRTQLTNDPSFNTLLSRIVHKAVLCETQSTANRLFQSLYTGRPEAFKDSCVADTASQSKGYGGPNVESENPAGATLRSSAQVAISSRASDMSQSHDDPKGRCCEMDPMSCQYMENLELTGKDGGPTKGSEIETKQLHDSPRVSSAPASAEIQSEDWDSDDYAEGCEDGQGGWQKQKNRLESSQTLNIPIINAPEEGTLLHVDGNVQPECGDDEEGILDVIDAFSDSRSIASCRPSSRASSRSGRDIFIKDKRDEHESDHEVNYDSDLYGSYASSLKSDDWKASNDDHDELDLWCHGRTSESESTSAWNSNPNCKHRHHSLDGDASNEFADDESHRRTLDLFSGQFSARIIPDQCNEVNRVALETNSACLALFSDESSSESGGQVLDDRKKISVFSNTGEHEPVESRDETSLLPSSVRPDAVNLDQHNCQMMGFSDGHSERQEDVAANDTELPICEREIDVNVSEWSSSDEREMLDRPAKNQWMISARTTADCCGDCLNPGIAMLEAEDSTVSTQPSGEKSREVVCDVHSGIASVWSEESISTDSIAAPSMAGLSPTLGGFGCVGACSELECDTDGDSDISAPAKMAPNRTSCDLRC